MYFFSVGMTFLPEDLQLLLLISCVLFVQEKAAFLDPKKMKENDKRNAILEITT